MSRFGAQRDSLRERRSSDASVRKFTGELKLECAAQVLEDGNFDARSQCKTQPANFGWGAVLFHALRSQC